MIHYLGYGVDGQIHSIECCPNGWPLGFDLESPNPTHELAVALKDMRNGHNPPIIGFKAWDCGSPLNYEFGEQIHPACMFQHTCYYDIGTDEFKPKAACNLMIDGETKLVIDGVCVGQYPTIDVPPGELVELAIMGIIPDGSTVTVSNRDSMVSVMGVPAIELTFEDNMSDAIEILTPIQGMSAMLTFSGKHVCNVNVLLRGWPST
jgi:hypothetical protein